jgi:metal-responsive CopG/Arc/MetJ family transcriptional regulator
MATATVAIPFQEDLLQQVDRFVVKNVRSRADIILDATRIYVEREQNWQNLFASGDRIARENSFSETDVMNEIKACRAAK